MTTGVTIRATRRGFITGLATLIAAPAIVRVASLMPVRGVVMDVGPVGMLEVYGRSPGMEMAAMLDDIEERIGRAFFMDLGAFGSAAIQVTDGHAAHIPLSEIYR